MTPYIHINITWVLWSGIITSNKKQLINAYNKMSWFGIRFMWLLFHSINFLWYVCDVTALLSLNLLILLYINHLPDCCASQNLNLKKWETLNFHDPAFKCLYDLINFCIHSAVLRDRKNIPTKTTGCIV